MAQTFYFFFSLLQGFSILALLTFWAGKFFIVEGCPVLCRMFNSIPVVTTKNCLQTLPNIPWREGKTDPG